MATRTADDPNVISWQQTPGGDTSGSLGWAGASNVTPQPPPVVTPPPAGPTQDALATLVAALEVYGYTTEQATTLANRAWGIQIESPNDAQWEQWLFQQPEFEQRFPGLNAMRQSGRAVTPNEWVQYEKQAVGLLRAAGLPVSFYDQPEDIGKFITNDVSVAELQQRVQMAQQAVYNDFDVQAAAVYGLDPGDLTAMLLDPTKAEPIVQRKYQAVQSAKIASQTGFGQLNQTEAERIAASGVDPSQQVGQFGDLAHNREVFSALNSGEQDISREDQIAATFEGNQAAKDKITKQAKGRVNVFDAGGGFSQGQRGYAGVG